MSKGPEYPSEIPRSEVGCLRQKNLDLIWAGQKLKEEITTLKELVREIYFSRGDYAEILQILNRPLVREIMEGKE